MDEFFIELTHFFKGGRISFRADAITTIRDKGDHTLIVTTSGQGVYVQEQAHYVKKTVNYMLSNQNSSVVKIGL